MPINQKISTIPQAGKRGIQIRDDFVAAQEGFQDHLTDLTVDEMNELGNQINIVAEEINVKAEQVANQAVDGGYSQTYINNSQFEKYEQYTAQGGEVFIQVQDTSSILVHKNNVELIEGTDYTKNQDGITIDLTSSLVVDDLMQVWNTSTLKNLVIKQQKADRIITVGAGGNFATINEALTEASKSYPIYKQSGYNVEISLLAGFIMQEQVIVKGIDLGWITITGVDAETVIQRDTLLTLSNARYPAFSGESGATLPIISQLFNMDATGDGTDRDGINIHSSSSIAITGGAGVKNASEYGIAVYRSSSADITGCNFSGAGIYGIMAYGSSIVNCESCDVSGAGSIGLYANRTSFINASSGNFSNAGAYGIYAYGGSTINAEGADASNSGSYGIYAHRSSTINAGYAVAINTGSNSIYANWNSNISALYSNCSTDGVATTIEYATGSGSTMDISLATGEIDTNIAINSLTDSGIIYQ